MAFSVKITPVAYDDIQTGINYYQELQPGPGHTFSDIIEHTLTRIAAMPYSASIAYNDVRYKVVERFPYIILYNTENTDIIVLRVFNTHQNPTF